MCLVFDDIGSNSELDRLSSCYDSDVIKNDVPKRKKLRGDRIGLWVVILGTRTSRDWCQILHAELIMRRARNLNSDSSTTPLKTNTRRLLQLTCNNDNNIIHQSKSFKWRSHLFPFSWLAEPPTHSLLQPFPHKTRPLSWIYSVEAQRRIETARDQEWWINWPC